MGIVAAAACTIVVGRWQQARDVRSEQEKIAGIYALAAQHPVPDGWRMLPGYRCLLYSDGTNPFAYEFCFDGQGRLVEATDRRTRLPVVWTLRNEPGKTTIRVNSAALDTVLREMYAYSPQAPEATAVRPALWFHPPPKPPRIPPGSGLPSARS